MIKIESIEFYNHYLFDNKKFSFTDANGNVFDTIVIAGENGCGKTTLLEEINAFFSDNSSTRLFGEIRDRKKILAKMTIIISENRFYTIMNDSKIYLHKAIITKGVSENSSYIYTMYFINEKTNVYYNIHDILNEQANDRYPKIDCIYSKVDINYRPMQVVQHTTSKKLDEKDTSFPYDLANEIQQLFVDITAQDYQELAVWVKQNPGKVPPRRVQNQRISRFNKAFFNIFHNKLKYSKVIDNIKPVFIKNKKEVEMNDLSSGEKQIVYRGAFLLRNINAIKGTVALIDEPEISMHPTWKKEIYNFYKRIFMDNKKQLSQLFIATHSDYVLDSALDDDNCLIISIEKKKVKKYTKKSITILPTVTLAEIKYTIFHIYSEDFHILLYGELQRIFSRSRVKGMDTKLIELNCPLLKDYYWNKTSSKTLPTYIRNCIDHPYDNFKYTKSELKQSIEYMIKIIEKYRQKI